MTVSLLELRVNADAVGSDLTADGCGEAREDVSMRLFDMRLEIEHVGHELARGGRTHDRAVAEVIIAQENIGIAVEARC